MMLHLGLLAYFNLRFLQWDGVSVPTKNIIMIRQTYLTSHEMREVVIQTAEPFYKREVIERLVKILYSVYMKEDLERVAANTTQLNPKEITKLLRLL